jgi:RNA polymerase sigma factor (sigma-70 family)
MDFDAASLIKNRLSELPYSFVFHEISSGFWVENIDLQGVRKAIDSSQDFIRTVDEANEGERYIAKKTLYAWFVNLNLRLAAIEFCTLSEAQLLLKMNGLRFSGTWSHPPHDYIEFGQNHGLLNHLEGQDRYNFPLSTVMSSFGQYNIEMARQYLLGRSHDSDITPEFEESILRRLRNALEGLLDSRQQYVILRRYGILGFDAMTLEEVGQELGLTRERIRQIEVRCWKRMRHPSRRSFRSELVSLLLIYVLNRNGSLLLTSPNIRRGIEFICEYLNVPIRTFPHINIMSIGDVSSSFDLPDDIWVDLSNLRTNVRNFLSALPLQLTQKDVEEISDLLIPIVVKRLTKTQKIYLVLKKIGRPAHFSEVTDMYTQMFPGEHTTEHSVNAALLREKHGVVWIGSKGTFALEEWGYQRPTCSLMDTIAQIVEQRYQGTGKPVPFVVIQAEIGKYRKLVNPASLVLASYCNPRLQTVDGLCFLPREEASDEQEVADSELDRILREFEKQAEGY